MLGHFKGVAMGSRNQLVIKWTRLLSEGQTCPRCRSTEEEIHKAVTLLKKSLKPLGVSVVFEKAELTAKQFESEPLQSNAVWINGRLLEEWIGGHTGHSQCCDICGPNECRTMTVKDEVYEVIPADVIVKAGLLATAQIREGANCGSVQSKECCPK